MPHQKLLLVVVVVGSKRTRKKGMGLLITLSQ